MLPRPRALAALRPYLALSAAEMEHLSRLLMAQGVSLDAVTPLDLARAFETSPGDPIVARALQRSVEWDWRSASFQNPWADLAQDMKQWLARIGAMRAVTPQEVAKGIFRAYRTAPRSPRDIRLRVEGAARSLKPWPGSLCLHLDANSALNQAIQVNVFLKEFPNSRVDPNLTFLVTHYLKNADHFYEQAELRQRIRGKGIRIMLSLKPYVTASPGNAADEANLLNWLDQAMDNYQSEEHATTIFTIGNHNGDSWSGTDEEWWAVEAKCLKVFQDRGVLCAPVNDKGMVWSCSNIVERLAAWTAEGVDPDLFVCYAEHSYVSAGHVPVHVLLAQDALARAGVTTPIWSTELAWDFIHSNAAPPANTREGRPDLFQSPANDWMAILYAWHRTHDLPMFAFDAPMLFERPYKDPQHTTWGAALAADLLTQIPFEPPTPAAALALGGYDSGKAADRAYRFGEMHGGGVAAGNEAAARVVAGYLFER